MQLPKVMQDCRHDWEFRYADILTGARKFRCCKCGAGKDGAARRGTLSWMAQEMLKATGRESVTLGEAAAWHREQDSSAGER
jgi:hypothetical protein